MSRLKFFFVEIEVEAATSPVLDARALEVSGSGADFVN